MKYLFLLFLLILGCSENQPKVEPFLPPISTVTFCSKTQGINQTKDPWNNFDAQIFHKAEKRCVEIYPDDPCVKTFYKRPERSYWVICGKKG